MRDEETKYRKKVTQSLITMGQVSIVESHATALGIPDVNFCSKDGVESWLELKWVYPDRMPVIKTTQVAWHRNRSNIFMNSFMLIGTWFDSHILVPGYAVESLKMLSNDLENWEAVSIGIWKNSAKPPMKEIMIRAEAERIEYEIGKAEHERD
jgi:hypothetical protein